MKLLSFKMPHLFIIFGPLVFPNRKDSCENRKDFLLSFLQKVARTFITSAGCESSHWWVFQIKLRDTINTLLLITRKVKPRVRDKKESFSTSSRHSQQARLLSNYLLFCNYCVKPSCYLLHTWELRWKVKRWTVTNWQGSQRNCTENTRLWPKELIPQANSLRKVKIMLPCQKTSKLFLALPLMET